MSVYEVTYYEARCDGCDQTPGDKGSDYAAWAEREQASDEWDDDDWGLVLDDGRIYCWDCLPADVCRFSDGDGRHSPEAGVCTECDQVLPALAEVTP